MVTTSMERLPLTSSKPTAFVVRGFDVLIGVKSEDVILRAVITVFLYGSRPGSISKSNTCPST